MHRQARLEWREHLFQAMPELIVADAVNVALHPVADVLAHPTVAAVVAAVRERGVDWAKIADAAGVSVREAKWAWSLPRVGQRPDRGRARGLSAAPRRGLAGEAPAPGSSPSR